MAYRIIIRKTTNYPHYERTAREYLTLDMAERELDRISNELGKKCNAGELQDYELDLVEI